MKIRLTSVENFEKVLEKLKQDTMYNEGYNAMFFKYCVPTIKEGLKNGKDEWYLDVDWVPNRESCEVGMVISYLKRSEIPTDLEYLTIEE